MNTIFSLRSAALIALLTSFCFLEAAYAAGDVVVRDAWARATSPGQTTASVYFDIVSADKAALREIRSQVAKRVEMHASRTENGVMRMRAVERLDLPAGKSVRLAPNGLHLMLIDIGRPLREHEKVPLELTIENARGTLSKVSIEATVRAAGAASRRHTH